VQQAKEMADKLQQAIHIMSK